MGSDEHFKRYHGDTLSQIQNVVNSTGQKTQFLYQSIKGKERERRFYRLKEF